MNLFFALVMIARTLNIANSCDGFCDSNNGQYDYTSSTVEYQGSYKKTGYDNVCCYEYLVTDKTSGNDCNGQSLKELSHWTLQAYCDEGDMSVFSGTNEPIQIDDTTCATEKGIKIDRGCSNSDGCLETFCLTFPNNVDECCVMDGWFRTKAGLVIAESSVAVPDCSCPTPAPTKSPSTNPSEDPTVSPSKSPSEDPTVSPTKNPTRDPSKDPTVSPTKNPTKSPSEDPTVSPTKNPTRDPSVTPTVSPTKNPTKDPSVTPTVSPTKDPSATPTVSPTKSPTQDPSVSPTKNPTRDPSVTPTVSPTRNPTRDPSVTPTVSPTKDPSVTPTVSPTKNPTRDPSVTPTVSPTRNPTRDPSVTPTVSPTKSPTKDPSVTPTVSPTKSPSKSPTKSPTKDPSVTPTVSPTKSPTKDPSVSPSRNPTPSPSAFCQPIIDIQLNDGCDDLEFDAADPDTEVQYTFSRYSLAAKPNGATTPGGTTEGSLSRKAFDHACGDDYSAAHGFAGPHLNNDYKTVSVDTKPKQTLKWYQDDYVQIGLFMYSVAMTFGFVAYLCGLGSRFHVKAAQHVQFDVIDDEADKML